MINKIFFPKHDEKFGIWKICQIKKKIDHKTHLGGNQASITLHKDRVQNINFCSVQCCVCGAS